jgi:hypothetical protein
MMPTTRRPATHCAFLWPKAYGSALRRKRWVSSWNASTRPLEKNGFGLTIIETDRIARKRIASPA